MADTVAMLVGDEDRIDPVDPVHQASQVSPHIAKVCPDIAKKSERFLSARHRHGHSLMGRRCLAPTPFRLLGHAGDLGAQPVLPGMGTREPFFRNGHIEHCHIVWREPEAKILAARTGTGGTVAVLIIGGAHAGRFRTGRVREGQRPT